MRVVGKSKTTSLQNGFVSFMGKLGRRRIIALREVATVFINRMKGMG